MGNKGSAPGNQTVGPNGPGATFYEHANYEGPSMKVGANYEANYVGDPWNDKATSIKIDPGIIVDMYNDDNFNGRKVTLTSDVPDLGRTDFNDRLSSFKIYKDCSHDNYKWDPDCQNACSGTGGACVDNRKTFCAQNRTDQRCIDWCGQVGNVCDGLTLQFCDNNPTNTDICGCYNLQSVKPMIDALAKKGTTMIPVCHVSQCANNAKAWKDTSMRGIRCPDQQICIQSVDMKVSASELENVNLNCNQTTTTTTPPAPTMVTPKPAPATIPTFTIGGIQIDRDVLIYVGGGFVIFILILLCSFFMAVGN